MGIRPVRTLGPSRHQSITGRTRLVIAIVAVAVGLTVQEPTAQAATPIITTFAGNGTNGYIGDGGPAASAELSVPAGSAFDSGGNMYLADNGGTVRKITLGGVISTVAGTGTNGYSGDGGAATSAKVNSPNGVAVDSSGNVYIADYGNNRIRKVTYATGIITTYAGNGTYGSIGDGGAATSAELASPASVTFDAGGDLIIADAGSNKIRMITPGGIISTIAGTGTPSFSGDGSTATSATLNQPLSAKLDSAGNIYIADYGNNRIRKISSGVITTVAGNGTAAFAGDGGPATSASLYAIQDLVVSGQGNIYIVDAGNQRIRKVDTLGNISTVVGTGVGSESGDSGPATSATIADPDGISLSLSGNLYISDASGTRVRMVNIGDPPSFASIPVTFTVDPYLTFAIAGLNSGSCNGATITATNSTATAAPLGHVSSLANAVAAQTLTVSSNAGNGYTVYVKYSGAVSDGHGHTIADWTGTNASPTAFSAAGTAAFGYSTDHALSGTTTRFQTNKWAGFTTANAEVIYQTAPYSADVAHVCFQEGVGSTTPAASYSTIATYTAVPVF